MFCIWVMDKFSPVSKMAVYGANVPWHYYSYALTTVRPVAVPFRSRPVPFHATETPVFHTDIRAGAHMRARYLLYAHPRHAGRAVSRWPSPKPKG